MKTWIRANRDHLCGGCGVPIAKGDPVLLITLVKVQRQRVRCVACAGPVPEGVTLTDPVAYAPLSFTRFSDLDWKRKQAGEEG